MRKHSFDVFAMKSERKTHERRTGWKIRNVIYKAEIRGFRTTLRETDRVEIQLKTCVKTVFEPSLSPLVMKLNVNVVFFWRGANEIEFSKRRASAKRRWRTVSGNNTFPPELSKIDISSPVQKINIECSLSVRI